MDGILTQYRALSENNATGASKQAAPSDKQTLHYPIEGVLTQYSATPEYNATGASHQGAPQGQQKLHYPREGVLTQYINPPKYNAIWYDQPHQGSGLKQYALQGN